MKAARSFLKTCWQQHAPHTLTGFMNLSGNLCNRSQLSHEFQQAIHMSYIFINLKDSIAALSAVELYIGCQTAMAACE